MILENLIDYFTYSIIVGVNFYVNLRQIYHFFWANTKSTSLHINDFLGILPDFDPSGFGIGLMTKFTFSLLYPEKNAKKSYS